MVRYFGRLLRVAYEEIDAKPTNFRAVAVSQSGGTVNYTYDVADRLTQVSDATGTYGFTYDNMGRLTGTSTQYSFLPGQKFTLGYGYDAASNRTSMTDPQGGKTTYAYDSLNRLQNLTDPTSNSFGFGYDALSRRTSLTRPNGVNTTYNYDSLSHLLSILHQASGVTLDGAVYTYDNAGNRLSKLNELNGVTENYTFDPTYQLTQVQQIVNGTPSISENYSYDLVGNRVSSLNVGSYSYNNSNELTSSADGYSYTYDNNGNTLTKTLGTNTTTFSWDFDNRLTQVTLPGSGGTVSFKYDPFGRRVQKISSTGTTNYVYDGADTLQETDALGGFLARYSQGLGIDEPLVQSRSGALSFYQSDALGSITSLSNAAAQLASTYSYSPFGNPTGATGTTVNPFRYSGRDFDSETGLNFFRARYYDQSVGRFLNEDPVGFGGQQVGFYSFVFNNPVDLVDRTGKGPEGAAIGGAIGILIGTPIGALVGGSAGATAGAAAGTVALPGGGTLTGGILGGELGGEVGANVGAAAGLAAGAALGSGLQDLWHQFSWGNERPKPGPPAPNKCNDKPKNDDDCAKEWEHAHEYCSELMTIPRKSADWRNYTEIWGGSYDRCVRGQVSQRCGGNRVE